jgi:hypothetical protein
MRTATNTETGDRMYLDEKDGKWMPLVTATNPETGERMAKTSDGWQPFEGKLTNSEALDLADAQLDALDGPQVEPTPEAPKAQRGVMETFNGAMDAVKTIGSEGLASAVGGTLGFIEGAVEAGIDGTYGTQEGVQQIQETMQQRGDILRRDPTTEAGKEILQGVGEVLEPLTRADQLGPLAAAVPTQPIGIIPNAVGVTAARAANAASEATEAVIKRLPGRGEDAPDTGVGAAEADEVAQMMVTAREFGFEGDSAPTVGQATRDPEQLRFENEAAKTEPGAGLQERRQNQQEQLGRVFDEKEEDYSDGLAFADDDDQGRAVQSALETRKAERKKERDDLYAEAKAAGEMDELIEVPRINTALMQLNELENIVPANKVVTQMAQKYGLIDADGNPQQVQVQQIENFREFVNKAYDYADPRERMERGKVIAALDSALDTAPSGKLYKAARANASEFRDEFFNSPLARDMTRNKTNANVSAVDAGKVYQKIRNASLQEIEQLRNTMMATPEGQRQWGGIQARMIQDIRSKAFGTQQDGARNQLATPSTFIKEIQKLSRSGKLKAILGDKEAQSMEDLAQLVSDLMTSPPGSANHSNTVAALKQWARMAPDSIRGLPVVDQVIGSIADANTKRKVTKALNSDSLLGSAL